MSEKSTGPDEEPDQDAEPASKPTGAAAESEPTGAAAESEPAERDDPDAGPASEPDIG
jgi:hypothetical protein